MPEHFLHMMDRPALFEPPTPGFVPEVVKMQVDQLRRGTVAGGSPGLFLMLLSRSPSAPKTYADGGYVRPAGSV